MSELEPGLRVIPWPEPETANDIEQAPKLFVTMGDINVNVELPKSRKRSPWTSGLFYLLVFVVCIGVVTIAARFAPGWAVLLGFVFALLFVFSIGALQLRQDDKLSESGFLKLVAMILKRLHLFHKP